MDTLSVNLSRGDVVVLLRAVEQAIAGCSCGRAVGGQTCDRCVSLNAVRIDLARVVARRPARRLDKPVRGGSRMSPAWGEPSPKDGERAALADGTPLAC